MTPTALQAGRRRSHCGPAAPTSSQDQLVNGARRQLRQNHQSAWRASAKNSPSSRAGRGADFSRLIAGNHCTARRATPDDGDDAVSGIYHLQAPARPAGTNSPKPSSTAAVSRCARSALPRIAIPLQLSDAGAAAGKFPAGLRQDSRELRRTVAAWQEISDGFRRHPARLRPGGMPCPGSASS